ncbi:hypothetical protein ABID29_001864 [Streptococcus rupicaprae]|uniref:Phage protein n=1 Tax=Streptococcus rupicaprae TaxID=759619 RepID=A0ABV2FJI4_9STRE
MSTDNLTILTDSFEKGDSGEYVTGLTIILDGPIKFAFDAAKEKNNYKTDAEVLYDVISIGLEKILRGE